MVDTYVSGAYELIVRVQVPSPTVFFKPELYKMDIKTIIKIIGIIIIIILLIVLCTLTLRLNNANREEQATPVVITPVKNEKLMPEQPKPQVKPVSKKPMTRDVNDMPKSDYKVPEIG